MTGNKTHPTMPNVDMKGLYETWEKAATAWFEAWSKSPAFLTAMGQTMEAQLGMKSSMNKMMENTLEAWRIPTSRDFEALTDRIAHLEERTSSIEESLGAPVGAGKGEHRS